MDVVRPRTELSLESVGDSSRQRTLICAACGRRTDTIPCGLCGGNPLLEGRYRLAETVDEDALGLVYSAVDLRRAGQPVVVRVLPLRADVVAAVRQQVAAWSASWQVQPHATVRSWQHAFVVGTGASGALVMVLPHSDAPRWPAADGRPVSVSTMVSCVDALLEGLVVLHGTDPQRSCGPLTRRRMAVGEGGHPVVLFPGEVERLADPPGEPGARPPELEAGAWCPAADLYRVAAFGLALRSGRTVAEVHREARSTRRPADATGTEPAERLLWRWLVADPHRRPSHARAALEALREAVRPVAVPRRVEASPSVEVPVGVAAVRVPSGVDTSKRARPESRSTAGIEASARRRRRISAHDSAELGSSSPAAVGGMWRAVLGGVVVLVLLVGLVSVQISLTATGVIDAEPWLPVASRSAAAP